MKLSVKGIIKVNEKELTNSKIFDNERLGKRRHNIHAIHITDYLLCLSWWCTRFSTGIVVSPHTPFGADEIPDKISVQVYEG